VKHNWPARITPNSGYRSNRKSGSENSSIPTAPA
jgi:hypothetical protein